jgi:RNA 2',3'-cyclic 3'-phosphodiesterase
MIERWRCFVAVPLDEELRGSLSTAVTAWRQEAPADALRWADPDGWHLTLAFLGSLHPGEVEAISGAIRGVAGKHRPTRVETGRLGAFHRAGSARTLWYGVLDADGALSALAGDLARGLGLDVEAPYRPHITLARARRRPVDLRGWIERASLHAPSGQLAVKSVELMRSHLGRGPARYETLASIELGGAA